jgi:hypothetical protein
LLEVPSAALTRLIRLEDLQLNRNNFEEIIKASFAGLDQLQVLSISHSPRLHKIQKLAFSSNIKLTRIDISNNSHLTDIEDGVFDSLPKLVRISSSMDLLQLGHDLTGIPGILKNPRNS